MSIHASGIIINVIMIIAIIVVLVIGMIYNNDYYKCYTNQSQYCYTIICPCDDTSGNACKGYSKMPGPKSGTWYCSDAPLTLVDNDGGILSS